MAPQQRQARVKKLSRTTGQPVLREDQLDSTEYHSLQANYNVETGVDKTEEKEYHLQAALAASGASTSEQNGEIPAPPAQESADIDYNSLYKLVFEQPKTYIRFSQTVEECTSCQYDMTTEDDEFLVAYNQNRAAGAKCSEDDFEKIMEIFEETAENKAPFASVDNTVVPFETMNISLKDQVSQKLHAFTKDIYEFWKTRRQNSGNKPLQPTLKFETHQDIDDSDPYVCFRRREVRQTRKTRARDTQSSDRLRRLRRELEDARSLIQLAGARETTKRQVLAVDRIIFDRRGQLRELKARLGIKTDDEDLLNQKQQKRRISDYHQLRQGLGTPLRLPGRSDGRPLDADLKQLREMIDQKEALLRRDIEEKSEQHRKWNENHTDLTREPLSPIHGNSADPAFRPVTTSWQLMTPPSSVTSEVFDQLSPSPLQEKPESFSFRYSSPSEEDDTRGLPAYRRRIGRGGRLWIDRRGMPSMVRDVDDAVSDRWKYDQDDDDEQPVYEMDPYDTKALRFRSTIPLPQLGTQSQRPRQDNIQSARPNGVNNLNRSIAAAPQPQAPT